MKGYKVITSYRTPDGLEHYSAKLAETHMENRIAEHLGTILRQNSAGLTCAADQFKILQTLMANRKSIYELLSLEYSYEESDTFDCEEN